MATWPTQQQVMPPTVVQQAGPQQGYSYDPNQVPMQAQQVAQPYYPGQPTPPFQQPQQMAQPPQTQYMQQPMQQPPMQPMQQPYQQQRMQFDESVVLDGPGVAPELRGRTMGDAMRLYKALSSDWLTRQRQPVTPAQQTLQAQGYGPQPGQYQQPPQGPPPTTPGQFQPQFTVPGAAQANQQGQFQQQLAQAVQQAVQPMLAPVVQHSQTQAIMQARDAARGAIADYGYLEADIIQNLNGATPEQLANPAVWQIAANAARGARVAAGQYQMQQRQPQLPGQNGQRGPGTAVPAGQIPPAYQFFTESPTAPNVGAGLYGGQARQATQEDAFYARQFGMPVDNYMAWKYGQQQPLGSY